MNINELEFKPVEAVQKASMTGTKVSGYFSIVNSGKNGKRIHWSKVMTEKLDLTGSEVIYISKTVDSIIISKDKLSENSKEFRLRESKGKMVTYCGSLVEEMARFLALDFDSRRVCYTVTSGCFDTIDGAENETFVFVIGKECNNQSLGNDEEEQVNEEL